MITALRCIICCPLFYFKKRSERNEIVAAELVEKGSADARTGEVERKDTGTRGKSSEQLSDREWAELMGTNRQTCKRVNGSIRKR